MSEDISGVCGEKALVLAVMEQAIRDYLMRVTTMLDVKNKYTLKALRRDAYRWIYVCDDEADEDTPFTFPWCCNELNISSRTMRKIIESMRTNNESPVINRGLVRFFQAIESAQESDEYSAVLPTSNGNKSVS